MSLFVFEPGFFGLSKTGPRPPVFQVLTAATGDDGLVRFRADRPDAVVLSGIEKDPEREARLFTNEFADGEPSSYRSLIATNRTVAVLSDVTNGDLDRAGRYRDLLKGFELTDELRAVLWADGLAWGTTTVYRLDGCFDTQDAERGASIAPVAAAGLRLVLLRATASRPRRCPTLPASSKLHRAGRSAR